MKFFSRQRFLRGVLSVPQAFLVLSAALAFGFALLFTFSYEHISWRNCMAPLIVALWVLAAYVDSRCHILPDPLLLLSALVALCSYIFSPLSVFVYAVSSAFVTYLLLRLVSHVTTLGRGDVKLVSVFALWLADSHSLLVVLLLALCGAALYSLVLIVMKRATVKTSIALGPWLVCSAVIVWVAQTVG